MKRLGLTAWIVCIAILAQAQTLFSTSKGEVSFYSDAPLETIEGIDSKVAAILNADSRDIAVQMRIIDFEFANKLMQEHFNENYLESEKYPNGTFKGKIQESIDLKTPGTYTVTASGSLTIHGVTKQVTIPGKIISSGNELKLEFKFPVKLEDFKVEIPTLVFQKIAEEVAVSGKMTLIKK